MIGHWNKNFISDINVQVYSASKRPNQVLKDLFESLKKINETESLFESVQEKFYPLNNSQGFTPRKGFGTIREKGIRKNSRPGRIETFSKCMCRIFWIRVYFCRFWYEKFSPPEVWSSYQKISRIWTENPSSDKSDSSMGWMVSFRSSRWGIFLFLIHFDDVSGKGPAIVIWSTC